MFDMQGQTVYVQFLFDTTQQVQAAYYHTCDTGFAFQSFWDNGKLRSEGFFKVGDAYERPDTLHTFDVERYEEITKLTIVSAQPLLREGVWRTYDTTGITTVATFLHGKKEGKWLFYDERDILRAVKYYKADVLTKDSSTNILLSGDTNAIKNILVGNWVMDFDRIKFEKIEQDYSYRQMPFPHQVFYQFNPLGTFSQNTNVGNRCIREAYYVNVHEQQQGVYQFRSHDTLELSVSKETRVIKFGFLSNAAMVFWRLRD
jgi:antitoxin component YwqK of YwqJK toxin-antitoxin module